MKRSVVLLILILLAFVTCYPIIFLLSGSLMGRQELVANLQPMLAEESDQFVSMNLLAVFPTLKNFVQVLLDQPEFFVMFWNSVKITVSILLIQLCVGVPAAWGFAKYDFPGRKMLFTLYLILMMMPFQVTMLSNYLVLDGMKLMNTHWAVILPVGFSTFPIFLMYRFFSGIPHAVIEAAKIDGANEIQVFWYIALPAASGGIIAAMVLGFLEYWNLIEQPMTFLSDASLWPLSLYLPDITAQTAGSAFASSIIALIPAILVFLAGEDYLEKGIMASALKE